jgi:hypothetical protein
LYETVPLALIPRGWKESLAFTVLSYVVLSLIPKPLRSFPEFALASGKLSTLFLYLPLTLMVLRRPNQGTVPAWLERGMRDWPVWLRGSREETDRKPATSPQPSH